MIARFPAFVFNLLVLPFVAPAALEAKLPPESGIYSCQKGNEESICDQDLRPIRNGRGEWSAIRVEYVGWCGSMGPYVYSCLGDAAEVQCGDSLPGGIRFVFGKGAHYRWENTQYGFICEKMVKKK